MIEIDIKPVKLSAQRPLEIIESYIQLHEKHLIYRLNFTAEEPVNPDDHALGWEETVTDYTVLVKKENIAAVQKEYLISSDKWMILMSVNGAGNDLKAMFNTEKQATAVFNTLSEWLFPPTYIEPT